MTTVIRRMNFHSSSSIESEYSEKQVTHSIVEDIAVTEKARIASVSRNV